MQSHVDRKRILTHPGTGQKVEASVIRDEIYFPDLSQPPYDADEWGEYVFGAWLEEAANDQGKFLISFPYWRNGRFAGQYTLRAEPAVIRALFREIERRGWLERSGWLDADTPMKAAQGPESPTQPEDENHQGEA